MERANDETPAILAQSVAACPYLPDIGENRHRAAELGVYRDRERGADFYLHALRCGQSRWLELLPAQALLMLNRAMGARLHAEENAELLEIHPMPYRAVAWILHRGEEIGFLGNPRRHYQHLATRMTGGDLSLRTARAWACWELAKASNPAWEADEVQIAKEGISEPTFSQVESNLLSLGLPGEHAQWRLAWEDAAN